MVSISHPSPKAPPLQMWGQSAAARSLRPVLLLSAVSGVPLCRWRSTPLATCRRAYSLAVTMGVLYLGFRALQNAVFVASDKFWHRITVPGIVISTLMTVMTAGSILVLLSQCKKSFVEFIDDIEHMDTLLGRFPQRCDVKVRLFLTVMPAFILTLSIAAVTQCLYYRDNYFLATTIDNFIIFVILLQFLSLCLILGQKFKSVNQSMTADIRYEFMEKGSQDLITLLRRYNAHSFFTVNQLRPTNQILTSLSDRIVKIQVFHLKLRKLASSLNDVYGPILTMLVIQNLAVTIECVTYVIIFVSYNVNVRTVEKVTCLLSIAVLVLQIASLVTICQSTSSEAKRTATLAEDLSTLNVAGGGSEQLTRQLRQLSHQVRHSPVSFSACSLFMVDGRLLTGYVAAVVTYAIILMQFTVE
ncbi:uncharacterized protein LOC126335690 [Schistocerca gregaria]|uniref:uncharacterized protein LOC126335690 n=1 Tax=Schistocerca gregaria TaxID=7010 RepID=UPI00211EEEB3|nr:uncharacterized protein LOC126335690 [Schistocerca gregaria]